MGRHCDGEINESVMQMVMVMVRRLAIGGDGADWA